jgi:hypothetical protein
MKYYWIYYRNRFVTQYITYLMCYKPIPIIYRTSLLQNSLNSYYYYWIASTIEIKMAVLPRREINTKNYVIFAYFKSF